MAPVNVGENVYKSRKPGIVEICIDGVWREVSENAIRDGWYKQGYDSNFIVRCLSYKDK